jgi:hypothetical protein
MRKKRRDAEAFSLSFLDCICCGFGAIILLLVLSKIYEPVIVEKSEQDLTALIAQLEEELFRIRGETTVLTRDLRSARKLTTDTKMTLAELQRELETIQGQYRLINRDAPELSVDEGELRAARQRLSEEMERLLAGFRRAPDDAVGGIPVDSEYIIFVIDTSGSMQAKWSFLEQKFREVLDAYPTVKGLQIMNDNGRFMFPQYGRGWIEDTPQLRQAVRNTISTWAPFSDSNPADGLIYALETFWDPEKKISIFVFGDDFTGNSMQAVVNEVEKANPRDAAGERRIRIHALGFPTNFSGSGAPTMAQKYAGLMRVVCERNGGTFVGLTERDRR